MSKPIIKVQDSATILNSLAKQYIGEDVIVQDDLSNILDFGNAYDALPENTRQAIDSQMVTLITEQIFKTVDYRGKYPDLIKTRRSYSDARGIIQFNYPSMPEAIDDATVYDPVPGSTNDPFINHKIEMESDYFSKPFAHRFEYSIPERWGTGMFLSANGFNQLVASVLSAIKAKLRINEANLSMALVRASIIDDMSTVEQADIATRGSARAVNLLARYNDLYSTTLGVDECMLTPEFLRFATNEIWNVFDSMQSFSTVYNGKSYPNYLDESAYFVLLSRVENAMRTHMLSDAFNERYLQLPNYSTVTSWKGITTTVGGAEPDFTSVSTVNDTVEIDGDKVSLDMSGILGTVFGGQKLGIYNYASKETSMYDPVGLKTNHFVHLFGDSVITRYENSVTFYVA